MARWSRAGENSPRWRTFSRGTGVFSKCQDNELDNKLTALRDAVQAEETAKRAVFAAILHLANTLVTTGRALRRPPQTGTKAKHKRAAKGRIDRRAASQALRVQLYKNVLKIATIFRRQVRGDAGAMRASRGGASGIAALLGPQHSAGNRESRTRQTLPRGRHSSSSLTPGEQQQQHIERGRSVESSGGRRGKQRLSSSEKQQFVGVVGKHASRRRIFVRIGRRGSSAKFVFHEERLLLGGEPSRLLGGIRRLLGRDFSSSSDGSSSSSILRLSRRIVVFIQRGVGLRAGPAHRLEHCVTRPVVFILDSSSSESETSADPTDERKRNTDDTDARMKAWRDDSLVAVELFLFVLLLLLLSKR